MLADVAARRMARFKIEGQFDTALFLAGLSAYSDGVDGRWLVQASDVARVVACVDCVGDKFT